MFQMDFNKWIKSCHILQYTATHCNTRHHTLQHTLQMDFNNWIKKGVLCMCVAAYFDVLPHDTPSLSLTLRLSRWHSLSLADNPSLSLTLPLSRWNSLSLADTPSLSLTLPLPRNTCCEREHLRCNGYYQCLIVCDFETPIAFVTSRSLSDDPLHRCEHRNF